MGLTRCVQHPPQPCSLCRCSRRRSCAWPRRSGLPGFWVPACLVPLPGALLLFHRRIRDGWAAPLFLVVMMGAAAAGAMVGASAFLLIPGAALALAAWDLVDFHRFVRGGRSPQPAAALEKRHALSLAKAISLGLLADRRWRIARPEDSLYRDVPARNPGPALPWACSPRPAEAVAKPCSASPGMRAQAVPSKASPRESSFYISGVSAESAPGKAWVRRMACESVTETLRRNLAGQSRPAKGGDQPEPSVAWCGGNPGCEAYTGSVQAV